MSEARNTETILMEYRKTVRNLFDTGAPDVIDNSSPRHASILLEEMIRHAQISFYAFSGQMDSEVWNANVLSALEDAVKRGVLIHLLVEQNCIPIDNGMMPESLRSTVRRFGSSINPSDFSHCAVGDGQSFRMEMNQPAKSAVFAANNPEFASRVLNIVEYLYTAGVPYANNSAA